MMIHPLFILHVLSAIMVIVQLCMLIPLGIAVSFGEQASVAAFSLTIFSSLTLFSFLYFMTRKHRSSLVTTKDGFLVVTLSWIAASAVGALPFFLSGSIPAYTDAFFETMSGFTTTGASILTEIEHLPKSMLFWRSLTHWLGGMGIVVLTVAVLPLLGIGGVQLLKAEAPGPTVDKLSHRITRTAKILWLIYIAFTVIETLLLRFGGMSWFDALTHTFGTLATGGFSPKNSSVGAYNSAYVDIVITVFMIAAGLNFGLYFRILTGNSRTLFRNTEAKVYLAIFAAASLLTAVSLHGPAYGSFSEALRYGAFQSASILTTTGFATANFDLWPAFSKYILFFLMFVGGCSGSTGGGIKVIRVATLFKQAAAEMKYLVFPHRVFRVRINGSPIRKDFVFNITGFVFLYILFLLITAMVVASGGYGILTSLSTSLATVGNIGPGFDLVGPAMNYSLFPAYIKWFLGFAMMVGRLEIYTVLVIFTVHFWKD